MKSKLILVFLLFLAFGCKRDSSQPKVDLDKFCSYINVEDIGKTIPLVNEFLSGLSAGMDEEERLHELEAWLNSCPCIIQARILFFQPGYGSSEIMFFFDDDGEKHRIMEISMTNPLEVAGYGVISYDPASIIGKWKYVKHTTPFTSSGPIISDYSQYDIVYEFKTNNVFTVSGATDLIDSYQGHAKGDHSYSIGVHDSMPRYISSVLEINNTIYYVSTTFCSLQLDNSFSDGPCLIFLK